MKTPRCGIFGPLVAPIVALALPLGFASCAGSAKPSVDDLVAAIEAGDEGLAAKLIALGLDKQVYRVPHAEHDWYLPIHIAAREGRPRILSRLLEQAGADPNARDYRGHTPLFEIGNGLDIRRGGYYLQCIDVLLNAHADVNATANSGETVMHYVNNSVFVVERYLAAGADPNHRDHEGNTPLHGCATGIRLSPSGNSLDAVPSLLIAGADPELVNNAGLTPRQLAVNEKRDDIVAVLDRFQRLRQTLGKSSGPPEPAKDAEPSQE